MKVAANTRGLVSLFEEDADEKSPAVFVFPWRINSESRRLLSGALFALVTRIVSHGNP